MVGLKSRSCARVTREQVSRTHNNKISLSLSLSLSSLSLSLPFSSLASLPLYQSYLTFHSVILTDTTIESTHQHHNQVGQRLYVTSTLLLQCTTDYFLLLDQLSNNL